MPIYFMFIMLLTLFASFSYGLYRVFTSAGRVIARAIPTLKNTARDLIVSAFALFLNVFTLFYNISVEPSNIGLIYSNQLYLHSFSEIMNMLKTINTVSLAGLSCFLVLFIIFQTYKLIIGKE